MADATGNPTAQAIPEHERGCMMGNPNPSPETRFQPGNPGGGKTSEQRKLEYEAAEMSARIRHRLLSVITEKLSGDAEGALNFLDGDVLRLMKDSEDRAHGTPKASTEITGADGGALDMRLTIERRIVDTRADEG